MRLLPGSPSLMTKLTLLVTLAVLLVVAMLGVYFDSFLKERFLEETRQRMERGYQRLAYNLKNSEHELRDGVAFFATDEKMIASISLINNYQDKENYNPFLIDEEKKIIAAELLNRIKLSFNNEIALYDRNKELIAYAAKGKDGYQLNFVSFEGGDMKLYRRLEQEAAYTPAPLFRDDPVSEALHRDVHPGNEESAGSIITYQRHGNDVVIRSHQSIFLSGGKQPIAHVEMSKILDNAYFEQLSRDISLDIRLSFDSEPESYARPVSPDWDIPALNVAQTGSEYIGAIRKDTLSGPAYFVTRLDKAVLHAMLNESRRQFYLLLVLVAVGTLLVMRYAIRGSLKRPLGRLMAQIRKIEKQDYSQSETVATGDELQDISMSVNQLSLAVQERENLLEKARSEQEYLSNHDALTNLPNRRLFSQRLQQSLDAARRNGSQLAIMFLDLDQFKLVNDTLGHDVGDLLLIQVADRLSPHSEHQLLARIGGDEFIVLVEGIRDARELKAISEKYLALLRIPFLCGGMELSISASIGVAMYPRDGEDSVTLIKHADLAMYKSKDKGRNSYSFYSSELAEYMQKRADITQALKLAIEAGGQFVLYYQPKIDTATGRIHAVEALIRWHSPVLGHMGPEQFVRIAEETGLIVPIGQWVLQQGCRDFVRLGEEGFALDHISMNVSNVQLRNDDVMSVLRHIIASCGIATSQIELEITESYIASDVSSAFQTLQAFRDMGIRLAIDDFGTGYSSMSYLKKLPVTRVKIDKSFIDGLPHNQDSVTLTRAVIALARNFGLATTAEGVENEEQRQFLEQEQCDEIQGYLYAKPMPFDELLEFCRATSGRQDNVIHLPGATR